MGPRKTADFPFGKVMQTQGDSEGQGGPGVLQFMESQRAGHDLANETTKKGEGDDFQVFYMAELYLKALCVPIRFLPKILPKESISLLTQHSKPPI